MISFLKLIYFIWAVNTLFVLPGPTPAQYYKNKKEFATTSPCPEGFMLLQIEHTTCRMRAGISKEVLKFDSIQPQSIQGVHFP